MKTYTDWGNPFSHMSLGTVQLGMDYGIANNDGQPSLERSYAVLDAALKGGVTALDTARSYGNSENVLGDYFRARGGKGNIFLTTKYGVPERGLDKAGVKSVIRKSIEQSLEALQLDKVDCYMLHSAPDFLEYPEEIAETMGDLKSEGLIGCAGLSIYEPEVLEKPLEMGCFSMVQAPMSMFDHALWERGYLARLQKANTAVIIRSVFLQGLFFLDPDTMEDCALKNVTEKKLRIIREIAKQENMTIAELAISYIRDMPGVTSLVLGAEKPEQVEMNLKYFAPDAATLSAAGRKYIDETCSANIPEIMKALSARYDKGKKA